MADLASILVATCVNKPAGRFLGAMGRFLGAMGFLGAMHLCGFRFLGAMHLDKGNKGF
jgi:hypothetical protein